MKLFFTVNVRFRFFFFSFIYFFISGTLNAFLKQKGQTTSDGPVWSLTGNQGDRWKQAKVSIHPTSSFQVRPRTKRSASFFSTGLVFYQKAIYRHICISLFTYILHSTCINKCVLGVPFLHAHTPLMPQITGHYKFTTGLSSCLSLNVHCADPHRSPVDWPQWPWTELSSREYMQEFTVSADIWSTEWVSLGTVIKSSYMKK